MLGINCRTLKPCDIVFDNKPLYLAYLITLCSDVSLKLSLDVHWLLSSAHLDLSTNSLNDISEIIE